MYNKDNFEQKNTSKVSAVAEPKVESIEENSEESEQPRDDVAKERY